MARYSERKIYYSTPDEISSETVFICCVFKFHELSVTNRNTLDLVDNARYARVLNIQARVFRPPLFVTSFFLSSNGSPMFPLSFGARLR